MATTTSKLPSPQYLARKVCKNEHLESIYLEYLRYCATQKSMKKILQTEEIINAVDTMIETSLALFLNEACRIYPIEKLNGEKNAFLEEVTRLINKKFQLEKYF